MGRVRGQVNVTHHLPHTTEHVRTVADPSKYQAKDGAVVGSKTQTLIGRIQYTVHTQRNFTHFTLAHITSH